MPQNISLSQETSPPNITSLNGFSSDNGKLAASDVNITSRNLQSTVILSADIHYTGPSVNYLFIPIVTLSMSLPFHYNDSLSMSLNISKGYYLNFNSLFLGNTDNGNIYSGAAAYGSLFRSKNLDINVFSTSAVTNNKTLNISFTLKLTFYASPIIIPLSNLSQILAQPSLHFNPFGYRVSNPSTLTLVRLPFYGVMDTGAQAVKRYSVESTLAQLVISSNVSSLNIEVTYGELFYGLIVVDIAFLISLSFIVTHRKRSKSGYRL